jgi:hypothetical protein
MWLCSSGAADLPLEATTSSASARQPLWRVVGRSAESQKRDVAKVAQTLFGVPFDATQVIGESLERATPEIDFGDEKVVKAIRAAIEAAANPAENYEEFRVHPLASWIESTFGVRAGHGSGRLVRQV